MKRNIEDIKKELISLPSSVFITKWILEHPPFIFEDSIEEYLSWRESIAQQLKIDPHDIIITGSASLGFSLNPNKNFKSFDSKSDVDISIISSLYFNIAWHDLIYSMPKSLPPKMNSSVADHRKRLIYWGTIATDRILPLLSFGKEWETIIRETNRPDALKGRELNFRIYKDTLSIRKYIELSVSERKSALLEAMIK